MAFKLVSEDKTFDSMLSIAKHLGKSRVYRKDFERLGIVEVEDEPIENEVEKDLEPTESDNGGDSNESDNNENKSDDVPAKEVNQEDEKKAQTDEPSGGTSEEQVEDKAKAEEEKKKAKREAKAEARKKANKEREEKAISEPPAYALKLREEMGIPTIEDLYKKIRGAKYEDVIQLAVDNGIGWDENPNPKINRMNVGKALRESLFPGQKRPHRPKSPWNGVPTEKVIELAEKNEIEIRQAESDKVTRMWLIKELKVKGVQPPK